MVRRPPSSPPFPPPPLSRSKAHPPARTKAKEAQDAATPPGQDLDTQAKAAKVDAMDAQKPGSFDKRAFIEAVKDRKSTRLNSSHANISYAVFCLKKNK